MAFGIVCWVSISSTLARVALLVARVSIIGNCMAVILACTGQAAGPRFKEI